MTVDPQHLDVELTSLAGWIACLADARTLDEYATIFREAGLRVARAESHDDTVEEMIDRIEARLVFLRLANSPALTGVDVDAVFAGVDLARRAVSDGYLGYCLLVAERPNG